MPGLCFWVPPHPPAHDFKGQLGLCGCTQSLPFLKPRALCFYQLRCWTWAFSLGHFSFLVSCADCKPRIYQSLSLSLSFFPFSSFLSISSFSISISFPLSLSPFLSFSPLSLSLPLSSLLSPEKRTEEMREEERDHSVALTCIYYSLYVKATECHFWW